MVKKQLFLVMCLCLMSAVASVSWAAPAGLVGWWNLEEGAGNYVADRSGNNNPGEIMGGANWVTGILGGALELDGVDDYLKMNPASFVDVSTQITAAAWINGNVDLQPKGNCLFRVYDTTVTNVNNYGRILSQHVPWSNGHLYFDAGGAEGSKYDRFQSNNFPAEYYEGNWTHIAFVKDSDAGTMTIYVNGELYAEATGKTLPILGANVTSFNIGADQGGGTNYPGMIDDIQLYNVALGEAEIQEIMLGLPAPAGAAPLSPVGADDVLRDGTSLYWAAGEGAGSYNVYLGTEEASLNLVASTTELSYPLGRLEFGKTTYWRVDVNEPNVVTGNVVSFEVEPKGIMISGLTVTASSQNSPEEDPNNTINGVGLNPDGSHSDDKTTMWLSAISDPGTAWIRYDLPEPLKLSEMLVWNHNTQSEEVLGYGIKDALIEVSADGVNFTTLKTVELLQSAETSVDMQGAVAQSVKITAQNNWGGIVDKFGVSAVRLLAIPMVAREMSPADGAGNVDPTAAVLSWRAGREAGAHNVLISIDEQAVIDGTAPAMTVAETSMMPDLAYGKTYYWRVDEVNDVDVWAGPVQSFATEASVLVDDMESYDNETWIWQAWADGWDYADNGSIVGDHGMPSSTSYEGSQSMPMAYGVGAEDSTATLSLPGLDWTTYGIQTLSLHFRGNAANVGGKLYVKVNDTEFLYAGAATDIQDEVWSAFTVDLTDVNDVNAVTSVTVGVAGGSGVVLIDNVRLLSQASEIIMPLATLDPANLVASYAFEGDYTDGSGNGLDGIPDANAVIVTDGVRGQVLMLDGTDDAVLIGTSDQGFNFPGSFSISAWANYNTWDNNWGEILCANRGESNVGWQLRRRGGTNFLTFTVRGTSGTDDPTGSTSIPDLLGEWILIQAVYDAEAATRTLYVNGAVDLTLADSGVCAPADHNVYIGARDDGSEQLRITLMV